MIKFAFIRIGCIFTYNLFKTQKKRKMTNLQVIEKIKSMPAHTNFVIGDNDDTNQSDSIEMLLSERYKWVKNNWYVNDFTLKNTILIYTCR